MAKNQVSNRWQDWGNLLLGLWLIISTWLLQYPVGAPSAMWNAYFLGAAIMIFSAFAVYMPRMWEESINAILGVWLIVSPWTLSFSSSRTVTVNAIIVGILVLILAAWAMQRDQLYEKWRRNHRAAP